MINICSGIARIYIASRCAPTPESLPLEATVTLASIFFEIKEPVKAESGVSSRNHYIQDGSKRSECIYRPRKSPIGLDLIERFLFIKNQIYHVVLAKTSHCEQSCVEDRSFVLQRISRFSNLPLFKIGIKTKNFKILCKGQF